MSITLLALLLLGPNPAPPHPEPFASMRVGFRQPSATGPLSRLNLPVDEGSSHRLRNAVIGAAAGAVAGVVTCTVISNLAKDPGTGFSTCTTRGYLLLGGGGAGLGALFGLLLSH